MDKFKIRFIKIFKDLINRKIIFNVKKMYGILDIKGDYDYPSCALSNCAKEEYVFGFTIDGVKCNCMEGFLQSLKTEDIETQKYICSLDWRNAQKVGRQIDWKKNQTLYWKGTAMNRKSEEYQMLLDRAYKAVLEQNERYRKALLDSKRYKLVHSIGVKFEKDTVLTEKELCTRLMKLRIELGKNNGGCI